ncbi:UpxY family transcription antiterminator [Rubrolithibacter danxiaensis]|uniref:UpxY family transcription antiterminator n=1 Tax=Rubrolithibacter danxiaensis TaxID=3390805 RepID=UPI003BF90CC9
MGQAFSEAVSFNLFYHKYLVYNMPDTLRNNWYTAYTYPNLEKKVYGQLLKQQVKAYLPMQRVIREWSDRRKELEIPLFPNYVFINISEKDRCSLFHITGLLRFVSFNGRPALISDEEISNIQKAENANPEIEPHLIQGEDVLIVKGPFTGLKGKFYTKRGKSRFGIRLNALHQSLSLEIAISDIRRI